MLELGMAERAFVVSATQSGGCTPRSRLRSDTSTATSCAAWASAGEPVRECRAPGAQPVAGSGLRVCRIASRPDWARLSRRGPELSLLGAACADPRAGLRPHRGPYDRGAPPAATRAATIQFDALSSMKLSIHIFLMPPKKFHFRETTRH